MPNNFTSFPHLNMLWRSSCLFIIILLYIEVFSVSGLVENVDYVQLIPTKPKVVNRVCGEWIDEYTSFHRHELNSEAPRLIVSVPTISGKLVFFG